MSKGQLYLISAPSGAGKTSLVSALLKQDDKIKLSISHTTRAPRDNEKNGVHYHFVTQEKFHELQMSNEFLEHANVYGNFYATSQLKVTQMLDNGDDVILEIDWQGARQVERLIPDSISICIAPPSIQSLRNRLEARGTDEQSVIEERMVHAKDEINHLSDAKYIIINDNFSEAVTMLQAIFLANRLKYSRQQEKLKKLGLYE